MEKFTLEFLITKSANIYFWLFIVFFIIDLLFQLSDEYKERIKIKKELGKINTGMTAVNFIFWFLFILSIYYI